VKSRPQLLLPLQDWQAFLEQSTEKGEAGGLFVPGEVEVELGEEVDVEVHFVPDQVRFHIRGVVKWKRENAGRRSIPPGIGIEFLPSERHTREHLLEFARGSEAPKHVERERRFHLQVDAVLKHGEQKLTGLTDDISEGGCFVNTDVRLPIGTPVEVKVRAPGTLFGWLTISATVAWTRTDPQRSGVGLAFIFETERKREKVKKIVALMKERAARELKIRTPRLSTPPQKP